MGPMVRLASLLPPTIGDRSVPNNVIPQRWLSTRETTESLIVIPPLPSPNKTQPVYSSNHALPPHCSLDSRIKEVSI